MNIGRLFLLLAAVFVSVAALSQDSGEEYINLEGQVLAEDTGEPLPYVSVYLTDRTRGTLTNHEGRFRLEGVSTSARISINFVGYQSRVSSAQALQDAGVIRLKPETELLAAAWVLADHGFLMDLIWKSSKTMPTALREAKSYYELETFVEGEQVELFQSYNNGVFQGCNVEGLKMKNARFALAARNERLFISTETSRAMLMHELTARNAFFPGSPFELNRRKLKKQYRLSLQRKFKDDSGRTVYRIAFEPIQDSQGWFSGEAFIDSAQHRLLKVDLTCAKAKRHPFALASLDYDLESLDMQLVKTFAEVEGEVRIQTVEVNYQTMLKQEENDHRLACETQAVLYAYDYSSAFELPRFELPNVSYRDYVQAQVIPHHPGFWKCTDAFQMKVEKESTTQFLNDASTITSEVLFSGYARGSRFFERSFIPWTGNRLQFIDVRQDSTVNSSLYDVAGIPSQQYNLHVQLFMDIHQACDSLSFTTRTVFDPHQSYYDFPPTPVGGAFINIWFDLAEGERRKLEIALEACTTVDAAVLCHESAVAALAQKQRIYLKEVQRGSNLAALRKWNEKAREITGIDNISWFGLED